MNQQKGTALRFGLASDEFVERHDLQEWEALFAPYGDDVYQFVLRRLHPEDVVVDIGAGDFRFALQAARLVKRVYAIEIHPGLVARFLEEMGERLPRNLHVVCANALDFPFPPDVTVGVLLMRHCSHFATYFRKLKGVGARSLFTNARWGMDVEEVDLTAERIDFDSAPPGWYACSCGAVGFKEPPLDEFEFSEDVHEVKNCPRCGTLTGV